MHWSLHEIQNNVVINDARLVTRAAMEAFTSSCRAELATSALTLLHPWQSNESKTPIRSVPCSAFPGSALVQCNVLAFSSHLFCAALASLRASGPAPRPSASRRVVL